MNKASFICLRLTFKHYKQEGTRTTQPTGGTHVNKHGAARTPGLKLRPCSPRSGMLHWPHGAAISPLSSTKHTHWRDTGTLYDSCYQFQILASTWRSGPAPTNHAPDGPVLARAHPLIPRSSRLPFSRPARGLPAPRRARPDPTRPLPAAGRSRRSALRLTAAERPPMEEEGAARGERRGRAPQQAASREQAAGKEAPQSPGGPAALPQLSVVALLLEAGSARLRHGRTLPPRRAVRRRAGVGRPQEPFPRRCPPSALCGRWCELVCGAVVLL